MVRPLTFVAIVCLFTTGAVGQDKSDIQGFYSGMNEIAFSAALRTNNLTCEGAWGIQDYAYNFISCFRESEPEEQMYGYFARTVKLSDLNFFRTKFLPSNLIWSIAYNFFTGMSGKELVSEISSVYGSKPTFIRARTALDKYVTICSRFLLPAAIWKTNTRTLVLEELETHVVRDQVPFDGWRLSLCDEHFLDQDKEAFERKKHAIAPPHKF